MMKNIGFGLVGIVFASLVACGGAEGSEGTESAPAVEQGQVQDLARTAAGGGGGNRPVGGAEGLSCPAGTCPSRHNTVCAAPDLPGLLPRRRLKPEHAGACALLAQATRRARRARGHSRAYD